jgi:hypothetical protein
MPAKRAKSKTDTAAKAAVFSREMNNEYFLADSRFFRIFVSFF